MSLHVTNVVLLDRLFDDFDELTEAAKYWDLDFRQIDRGPFRGRLLQVMLGSMLLCRARFERCLQQQGTTPRGVRTFAVPAGRTVAFNWRKLDVGPDDLLVFPASGELQGISATDFHVFTISLPEAELETVAESLGVVRWSNCLKCEKVTSSDVVPVLRNLLQRSIDGRALLSATGTAILQTRVSQLIVQALHEGTTTATCPLPRLQTQALNTAETIINQFEREPLNVVDLCESARVSERTLRNAFQRHFGLSPKAYLTARRLNGVRRELRQAARTGAGIGEIAAAWGFWHMGQFAADYRSQFGELPSESLQRFTR